jgi:hypothetical protein
MSVKDSASPAVLGTYLERYPDGEFAPIARALIEHYGQQLKADVAAREQERKREEEQKKAAEVKRLEEERRARELALAEERKRAEEAKNAAAAKLVDEKQRGEWLAHAEELKKALEEVRLAREAAATAEKQRLAAVKAAEGAAKAAEQAIAAKRDAEKTGDPTKLAALPRIEAPLSGQPANAFDGTWRTDWSFNERCRFSTGASVDWAINGGVVTTPKGHRGTVDGAGQLRISFPCPRTPTYTCSTRASLRGTGTWRAEGTPCGGKVRLSRM